MAKSIAKATDVDLTFKYKLGNELTMGKKFGVLFQIPKRNAAYEELKDKGPPEKYRYTS